MGLFGLFGKSASKQESTNNMSSSDDNYNVILGNLYQKLLSNNIPNIHYYLDQVYQKYRLVYEGRKVDYRLTKERMFEVCNSYRPGYLPTNLSESEYLRQWRDICMAPYENSWNSYQESLDNLQDCISQYDKNLALSVRNLMYQYFDGKLDIWKVNPSAVSLETMNYYLNNY